MTSIHPARAPFDAKGGMLVRTIAAGVSLLASLSVGIMAVVVQAQPLSGPVRIDSGLVEGVRGRNPDIAAFKGIPYVAAPVGELRWRPPAPVAPWQGVHKADSFGPACPQPGRDMTGPMDENCLFLNVWTGASSSAERRPVLVWFHGGGFFSGTGSAPATIGEGLAGKGVVLVTFNYRLGPLGFMASPELSAESGHGASGNYGLLDEIEALKWIKRNIAAFGGDPDQVTVFGHSAGAGSINFLSMSPLAKGLYKRALAESQVRWPSDLEIRYLSSSWRKKEDAEQAGTRYFAALGVPSLAQARALPWQSLPNPGGSEPDTGIETRSTARPPQFRPVIDGWVLPRSFSQTFAAGTQNPVEYIAGNNLDEGGAAPRTAWARLREMEPRKSAINMGSPFPIVTLGAYETAARKKFGTMADEFLTLYPATTDDEAAEQNNRAIRDNSQISTWLWAQQWHRQTGRTVRTYFWTHALTGPTHDMRGAFHGSEINYVFNSLAETDLPWTPEDRRIADMMSSYWANYARTGDPNGPGLPRWPAFTPQARTVMALGDSFEPRPLADEARFDFWKRFFAANEGW